MISPGHLIVGADVEQDDFTFGDQNGEDGALGVGDSNRVTAAHVSMQRMKVKMWLMRIVLQVLEYAARSLA